MEVLRLSSNTCYSLPDSPGTMGSGLGGGAFTVYPNRVLVLRCSACWRCIA